MPEIFNISNPLKRICFIAAKVWDHMIILQNKRFLFFVNLEILTFSKYIFSTFHNLYNNNNINVMDIIVLNDKKTK